MTRTINTATCCELTTENKQKILFAVVARCSLSSFSIFKAAAASAHTVEHTEFNFFRLLFGTYLVITLLATLLRCLFMLHLWFLDLHCREDATKNNNKIDFRRNVKRKLVVSMSFDAARTALCFSPFEPCDSCHRCRMQYGRRKIWRYCFGTKHSQHTAHNLSQYYFSLRLQSAHDKCCPTITVALKHNTVFFSRFSSLKQKYGIRMQNERERRRRRQRRRKRQNTERTIHVRLQLKAAIELAHTSVCSERFNEYIASIAFYSCMYSHLVLVSWKLELNLRRTENTLVRFGAALRCKCACPLHTCADCGCGV